MTVNELIKELTKLVENGYDDAEVEIVPSDDEYASGISSIVEEEFKTKKGDKKKIVFLYQE